MNHKSCQWRAMSEQYGFRWRFPKGLSEKHPMSRPLRFAILAAALGLALAACSGEPDPSATATSTSEVPTEVIGEPDATFAAGDSPADEAAAQGAIPPVLRGRWGLVPADCTSTAGDAKGLLTVSADELKFYESVATLTHVKSASADAVTADFAFSGEGQSWSLQVALSSVDGGRTMLRKDTGADAAPQPLTYTRCA